MVMSSDTLWAPTNESISPNLALQNEGFRNYAEYMMTEEFRQAAPCMERRSSHYRW